MRISRTVAAAVAAAGVALTVSAGDAQASPVYSSSWANNAVTGQCSGRTFNSFVIGIQEILGSEGYYQGAVDGSFGPGTLAAVKSYQRGQGLSVDGCVGPSTWSSLRGQLRGSGGWYFPAKTSMAYLDAQFHFHAPGCVLPHDVWLVDAPAGATRYQTYVMDTYLHKADMSNCHGD